jgi:septin family protein
MNVVEKRDFIHSFLHRANEKTINEFYEKLREEEILAKKLESRALKAEVDIQAGKVFSRQEIEQRTTNTGR